VVISLRLRSPGIQEHQIILPGHGDAHQIEGLGTVVRVSGRDMWPRVVIVKTYTSRSLCSIERWSVETGRSCGHGHALGGVPLKGLEKSLGCK
jgi:hypothetical protein